jgi:hypothetical protein
MFTRDYFSHGKMTQPWLSIFWNGDAASTQENSSQEFPQQEDPGQLPQCSLTEDIELFGSEKCNVTHSQLLEGLKCESK